MNVEMKMSGKGYQFKYSQPTHSPDSTLSSIFIIVFQPWLELIRQLSSIHAWAKGLRFFMPFWGITFLVIKKKITGKIGHLNQCCDSFVIKLLNQNILHY